jgi:hypothetical protein
VRLGPSVRPHAMRRGVWVSICIAGPAHAPAPGTGCQPGCCCCCFAAAPFLFPAKGMDGHPMYPCAKLKLDQLFLQWLSLPESQTLVRAAAVTRGGLELCSTRASNRETARLVQSLHIVIRTQ